MPPTDIAAAVNARLTPIVEYVTEPRAWHVPFGLAGRTRRELTGQPSVIPRWPMFGGYSAAPQNAFKGQAALAMGSGLPNGQASPELSDTVSTDSPALNIFRDRMRRQQR